MGNFLFLLLVAIGAVFWWQSQKSRQAATQAAVQACNRSNLQFLDGTVHLRKYWPMRTGNRSIQLCRLYFFEYSNDGSQRLTGRLVLVGTRIIEVELDAYRIT